MADMSILKTNWLFESDTYGEGIAQLVEEVERQGMKAVYAATVPMRAGASYLDLFANWQCVLFYGSLGFSKQIRQESMWVPGVFHSPVNFLCSNYYPHLHPHMLASSGYIFTTFGELITKKDFLFEHYGQEGTIFLRPDSGEKIFTGQLMEYDSFEQELPKLGYDVIPDDTQVVISEPKNIDVEWRFVVADHLVITGSRYLPFRLRMTDDAVDQEALQFAQKAVDDAKPWKPDRMWCIDVCRTVAGNYYVIEINSFSCSGLYACNPKPIVEHASRLALEEWLNHNVS